MLGRTKAILVVGLVFALAVVLVPPWRADWSIGGEAAISGEDDLGYALLFSRPQPRGQYAWASRVVIDWGRFALGLGAVVVMAALALAVQRGNASKASA